MRRLQPPAHARCTFSGPALPQAQYAEIDGGCPWSQSECRGQLAMIALLQVEDERSYVAVAAAQVTKVVLITLMRLTAPDC